MARQEAVEFLVEQFIADVGEIVTRVCKTALLDAMAALETPSTQERPSRRGAPKRRLAVRDGSGGDASPLGAPAASASGARRSRGHLPSKAMTRAAPLAVVGPLSGQGGALSALTDREARVVEAVRAVVRGTTAEIAQRSGLPTGTVYVLLRALVARGHLARTSTERGYEFSLLSASAPASSVPDEARSDGVPSAHAREERAA